MVKWFFRLLLIGIVGIVGIVGYTAYETHRKGYFSIPDMPDGSYVFSFRSGFRGVVLEAEVSDASVGAMPKFLRRISAANSDRIYFGVPTEVAPWMIKAWSTCTLPSEEDRSYFKESLPPSLKQELEHARLEAMCLIDVDGDDVPRGLLYSVPKLK